MFEKGNIIGNTPMIRIDYEYKGIFKYIYTKLEYYNLTGSIKDRVAYYMINNAKKRGALKEKMPIVEATSGNTGIALAALGKYYHHPVYIFMPNWVSKERTNLMKSYGANVILISKEQGGFIQCIEMAKQLAKEKQGFLANQFANQDNFQAHYETTAEEILQQVPEKIGGFLSGIGTGGTLMGTGKKLKEKDNQLKIIAIEPDKMPMLSQGKILSQHKIEGIGDDFIPDLVDKNAIDEIILVNDDDAINMAKKLASELGLGVGISSGANLIGAILANHTISKPMVTVFADDNKKYLSTDLSKKIIKEEKFISNQIKLKNYKVLTCYDN